MIVQTPESHTLTSGDLKPMAMGISDDPTDQLMILNVLSNTLYTDKIAAVLREYGCNACDANVEAGKGDEPIEVRLPNRLEPTCAIRDYGFGMTEDQMRNTFCRLGRSTKRASNEFTGMLGIGSKAGFAYGDSFLVTSFVGGTKTVYNAFRDKGAPQLAKMHEAATDEPDGVEIKVPVRTADIAEFAVKAERIYRFFKVRPRIIGVDVHFNDAETTFAGTGWRYTGCGRSFAIMGNVGYDLRGDAMGEVHPAVKELISLGVELTFDIGELEIAANREGLQYRDLTKASVSERLKVVRNEIGKIFTDKISEAPTLWEAHALYGEAFEQYRQRGTVRTLKGVVDGKVSWHGTEITTGRVHIENKEQDDEVSLVSYAGQGYSHRLRKEDAPCWVYANDRAKFCINDMPRKTISHSRVQGYFRALPNADGQVLIVCTFADDKAQARFWQRRRLDGAPTILMSSITPWSNAAQGGGTSPGPKNSKHSAKVFTLDESKRHSGACSSWWVQTTADLKDDAGVYVVIDTFKAKEPGQFGSLQEPALFQNKVVKLRQAGLIDGPVYGFKHDRLNKLGKKWVKLDDHVRQQIDKQFGAGVLAQQLANYLFAAPYDELLNPDQRKFFPTGPAQFYAGKLYEMRNPKIKGELRELLLSEAAKPWLKQPTLPAANVDLVALEKDVFQAYPMVRLWHKRGGRSQLASLSDKDAKELGTYLKWVNQHGK